MVLFILFFFLVKKFRYGLALGLNGALMNWAIQSFTIPKCFAKVKSTAEMFNPILTDKNFNELKEKIDLLQFDIDKLRGEK